MVRGDEQMANAHRDGDHQRYYSAWTTAWSWREFTNQNIVDNIKFLEPYCSEFLIHAADNEGLQQGIDMDLVARLADWCSIPVTYAGGARTVADLDLVNESSHGKVDLTIGSALDVFGGTGARFEECVQWNQDHVKQT